MESHEKILEEFKILQKNKHHNWEYAYDNILKAMNLAAKQALSGGIKWALDGWFDGDMTVDKETFEDYLKEINENI